jgi:hypothetical protein
MPRRFDDGRILGGVISKANNSFLICSCAKHLKRGLELFAVTHDMPACKDRFMICGRPEMLRDLKAMAEDLILSKSKQHADRLCDGTRVHLQLIATGADI